MNEAVIPFKKNRMSERDYETHRQHIREIYGDSKNEAGIRWEQALATLMWQSGWSQEELAAKEGKAQSWVNYRVRFGRFLTLYSGKISSGDNLTERRFRQYWDSTTGNDNRRFSQIAEMIQADDGQRVRVTNRNALMDQIREHYSNGKWHATETIASRLKRENDEVERTLAAATSRGARRYKIERRRRGPGYQYRIFSMEKQVSSAELAEKLGPIIVQLKAQGSKNMATIAISLIASIASELQQYLDDWTQ